MPAQSPPFPAHPRLIGRYLERTLGSLDPAVRQVRVEQVGEMFRRPGGRAMRFAATERFAVDRVAFVWTARFPVLPLIGLRVSDGYDAGQGALTVRALGMPLQRQDGPATALGEVYRYLAELPWALPAMAANPELEWRELDDRLVEVATAASGERAAVTMEFDPDGDIVQCLAVDRPMVESGGQTIRPWGGTLSAYRFLEGIRMPTRAEVFWDLPEGRFVYWRAEVVSVKTLAEPFQWRPSR